MPPSFIEDRRKAALEGLRGVRGAHLAPLRLLDHEPPQPRRGRARAAPLRGPRRRDSRIVQEHLGDEEHAALIVQRGASVVHTDVSDDRIIVMPLEQAVEEHPDLVEEWFAKRLPYDEGKFPAGNAALLDRRRVRARAQGREDREADPGGLADRRAGHGPVGAHPRGGGRARRVQDPRVLPRARLRGPGAPRRAPSSCTPARARRWTSPTTRTGAPARCTTCRSGGSRSRATRASSGCRSTSAGA